MRGRGFTLLEVIVFVVIILILAAFLQTSSHGHRANGSKCANNLKQVGMAAIQYADDKRFFPHIGDTKKLDGGFDSDTAARAHRALAFYDYDDNPESFICPSSPDQFKPLEIEARADIRNFFWTGGARPADATISPLYAPAAGDQSLGQMLDLSYGWTKRSYTNNSPSSSIVAGDKSRLLAADDSMNPTNLKHRDNAIGNHKDAIIVVCVDAHTQRVTPNGDQITTTTIAAELPDAPSSGYLGVLQDDEVWSR